jgi:replication factor A1
LRGLFEKSARPEACGYLPFLSCDSEAQNGRRDLREKKVPLGESLAFLSVKYNVNPDKFFQALASTKETQKAKCGDLSIECREKIGKERIFLIMKGAKVVAQVRVSEGFLLEKGNPLSRFMDTDRIRRFIAKKSNVLHSSFIRDLRVGMRHVNLNARVLEIPEPTCVYTRFGNNAVVANALIGDATGTIKLCLWNDQIGCVSVGDNIQIRNARAFAFKGEKQLRVGTKGTVKVWQERAIKVIKT